MCIGRTPAPGIVQGPAADAACGALTALAVGFAVSIGQYLPTLLLGWGRVPTITTEAVALSSGGDRRIDGRTGAAAERYCRSSDFCSPHSFRLSCSATAGACDHGMNIGSASEENGFGFEMSNVAIKGKTLAHFP